MSKHLSESQLHSEAHKIAGELSQPGHMAEAKQALMKEVSNPKEMQNLVKMINSDLAKHGEKQLSLGVDKHGKVSHLDFGAQHIYDSKHHNGKAQEHGKHEQHHQGHEHGHHHGKHHEQHHGHGHEHGHHHGKHHEQHHGHGHEHGHHHGKHHEQHHGAHHEHHSKHHHNDKAHHPGVKRKDIGVTSRTDETSSQTAQTVESTLRLTPSLPNLEIA